MEETFVNDVYIINNKNGGRRKNPYIGHRVRCTWLRAWQGKPAGHVVEGELVETFTPNGRSMIGRVRGTASDEPVTMRAREHSCPWAKKWLAVAVLN